MLGSNEKQFSLSEIKGLFKHVLFSVIIFACCCKLLHRERRDSVKLTVTMVEFEYGSWLSVHAGAV